MLAGGFCLFDSQYSNYTVMQSSYKRDILVDFAASCKKYGVDWSAELASVRLRALFP